jgi:hypothetical protein
MDGDTLKGNAFLMCNFFNKESMVISVFHSYNSSGYIKCATYICNESTIKKILFRIVLHATTFY